MNSIEKTNDDILKKLSTLSSSKLRTENINQQYNLNSSSYNDNILSEIKEIVSQNLKNQNKFDDLNNQ